MNLILCKYITIHGPYIVKKQSTKVNLNTAYVTSWRGSKTKITWSTCSVLRILYIHKRRSEEWYVACNAKCGL